jgi:hypothetical protein
VKLTGVEYIQHRFINRPWGVECQFTAAKPDGTHINEVIKVESAKIEEADLAKLVQARCDAALVVPDAPVDTRQAEIDAAVAAKEAEIKTLLVAKELITAEQTIYDVKTKEDYSKETSEEAVKP